MAGPIRQVRPSTRRRALVLAAVLLAACGSAGGDPAARQRYEADDRRCRAMADSMAASARSRGREVADDEYEPARVSCMTYRGWKNGKFN